MMKVLILIFRFFHEELTLVFFLYSVNRKEQLSRIVSIAVLSISCIVIVVFE